MESTMMHRYNRFANKALALDSYNKKLGGVCGGIARYLGIAAMPVRVIAVISLLVAPHLTLLAYAIAYFVLDSD